MTGDPSSEGFAERDQGRSDLRERLRLVAGAVALAVPTTLAAAGTAFDLASPRAADQFVYAQGAYQLGLAAVLTGVVATIVLVAGLSRLERTSLVFRHGQLALILVDLGLVWFGMSSLRRVSTSTYAPVPTWSIGASGLATLVMLTAVAVLVRAIIAPEPPV